MDSKNEQLHPNWRALATVNLRLKRFIPAKNEEFNELNSAEERKSYEIRNINGQEIKEFYEDLTKEEENKTIEVDKCKKRIQSKVTNKRKVAEIVEKKSPFDAQKFFRYAMENRVEELKKFEFTKDEVNIRDDFGWTALMMAACEGASEVVELLISIGADKTLEDRKNNTALDLARKKCHSGVVNILQREISANPHEALTPSSSHHSPQAVEYEPFYCDICKMTFRETSQAQHVTSTIHKFNEKTTMPANKLQKFNIASRNRGLQLMVKQGWDKESGLGPNQNGRLYPIKTVLRKERTGLGIKQSTAKVTHFNAFDLNATRRRTSSDYYKKKPRNRNDIQREKVREWKRERRLRKELN